MGRPRWSAPPPLIRPSARFSWKGARRRGADVPQVGGIRTESLLFRLLRLGTENGFDCQEKGDSSLNTTVQTRPSSAAVHKSARSEEYQPEAPARALATALRESTYPSLALRASNAFSPRRGGIRRGVSKKGARPRAPPKMGSTVEKTGAGFPKTSGTCGEGEQPSKRARALIRARPPAHPPSTPSHRRRLPRWRG
jgi:hypothetical protein